MDISKKIKRIKIGQKKVVIVFDNDDKLEISPNVYTEFNLFPNKSLSKKDIDELKKRSEVVPGSPRSTSAVRRCTVSFS